MPLTQKAFQVHRDWEKMTKDGIFNRYSILATKLNTSFKKCLQVPARIRPYTYSVGQLSRKSLLSWNMRHMQMKNWWATRQVIWAWETQWKQNKVDQGKPFSIEIRLSEWMAPQPWHNLIKWTSPAIHCFQSYELWAFYLNLPCLPCLCGTTWRAQGSQGTSL